MSDIIAVYNSILRLQQTGKSAEALSLCDELLRRVPNDAVAHHMAGMILCAQDRFQEGLASMRRSLLIEPLNPEFHNNLASSLGQNHQFTEARVHIDEAIRLDPAFGLAYYNLGVNNEHADDMKAAEHAYRKAISLMPDHLDSQYRLGCVLYYLGRYADSEECHLKAFEPAPPSRLDPQAQHALSNPRIIVVVTCKGRLAHLRQTLPALLSFSAPLEYRVVVVDFADPEGSFEWCSSLKHPRLVSVRVLDHAQVFHKSRAFNCGANVMPSDILCFVDADSILDPKFLRLATQPLLQPGSVITKREVDNGAFDTVGVCCVRTSTYRAVHGYDEEIHGYGPEDMDFFARARQHGRLVHFPAHLYPRAISHSQHARTQHYALKDMKQSAKKIVQRILNRNRVVNPNGYGLAECMWSSIETDHLPVTCHLQNAT